VVAVKKTALFTPQFYTIVERVQKWKMAFSLEIQKNSKN
jgi:hypothetical protein